MPLGLPSREPKPSTTVFKRVLIANRGEIAVRVARACRELGIQTVAVFSDADRTNAHVTAADEAYHIGPARAADSYLNVQRLIETAQRAECDAIHPGYGFLAENAGFARACAAAGLTFIGPSPGVMEEMGDKIQARLRAANAGFPVVPGSTEAVAEVAHALSLADSLGYPVAIKASAGGGGKGLKIAHERAAVAQAFSLAAKEAAAYFGDGRVYLERYLAAPKHVEIQILGDKHGHVIHLGERDCSLQRRHQKLVEETPALISAGTRRRMLEAAVGLALAMHYDSAGTIECLVEGDEFFFLEMNTRIQVEHTISEAVYGIDLVKAQIRIAAGEALWLSQADIVARGHAIECRINAEAPLQEFSASPGLISAYREPGGPGVRVDAAAYAGWNIPTDYDSLIAKLIAWGMDREEARLRMLRALAEFTVSGVTTTIPLFQALLESDEFRAGSYSTSTVETFMADRRSDIARAYDSAAQRLDDDRTPTTAAADGNSDSTALTVEGNGKRFEVRVSGWKVGPKAGSRPSARHRPVKQVASTGACVQAPMHGVLSEIRVKPDDAVTQGQVIATIEAMKMMNEVIAHRSGVVKSVEAAPGSTCEAGACIVTLTE